MNPPQLNNALEKKIILSIETTVAGGSLSILANNYEPDGWIGSRSVSKAEDILEQIAILLRTNNIKREHIKLIGVSKGSGSLTGEKIGLALARGLAKSLKCRLVEISVFESLLMEIGCKLEGEYLTAIPLGKNQVQWQEFTAKNNFYFKKNSSPQVSHISELINKIKKFDDTRAVLASGFDKFYVLDEFSDLEPLVNISSNSLAKLNAAAILKCV